MGHRRQGFWRHRRPDGLLNSAGFIPRRLDHPVPSEALVGLVAGRGVERHQRAGAVLVEAGAPSLQWKRDALGEQALAVGRRDHPEIRIDQQHARLVGCADAHALHDGASLRFPVEMDGQHADWFGVRLAAGANAGAIGHDLGIAEQGLAFDVADGIIVAGAKVARRAKPFRRRAFWPTTLKRSERPLATTLPLRSQSQRSR